MTRDSTVALTSPAESTSSAIAALRTATWPSHQRMEKRIDVKSRFATLDAYRSHLARLWGICAAIEARLPADVFGAALPDYPARRKLPLLSLDLVDLGLRMDAIRALPRCASLPDLPTPAAAFGCVYVFEGASLGGRTLLPLVEARLGLTPAHGARFLASYGAAVNAMWARFGAALDAWCRDEDRRRQAQSAAIATFEALEAWLCAVPA